jgi:nucleoid-associated protein
MAIKHIIIHVVKRDEDGGRVFSKLRPQVNNIDNFTNKLTEELLALFSSATLNFGEYGVDGDNSIEPPFEQKINSYYSNDLVCSDFIAMTHELAQRYKTIIERPKLNSVKGGYLVFYQYEINNADWLGVAIIPRNKGVDISDELDVVDATSLDLNKLHQGATINLTQWKSQFNTRYIRFKVGVGKGVRDYFEEFIGCQMDKLAAKTETRSLKKAILDYAQNTLGLDDSAAEQKLELTQTFIKQKIKDGDPVLLSAIANAIFPDSPSAFLEVAKESHQVSEELPIDTSELSSYKRLSGRGGDVAISFGRKMLGDKVIYEKDGDQELLIFKVIPPSLKAEIIAELKRREQVLLEERDNQTE